MAYSTVTFSRLLVLAAAAATMLSSINVQFADAHALRHDTARASRFAAEQVALRERYHAIRYRGAVDADEDAKEIAAAAATPSLLEAIVHKLTAMVVPSSHAMAAAVATALSKPAPAPAPATAPVARKPRRGQFCIVGVCGLHLFFASAVVTFVACAAVVCLIDRKRLDTINSSARKRRDNNEQQEKQMMTKAPTTPTKKNTMRKRASTSGLRSRLSSLLVRRSVAVLPHRAPLGI